MVRVDDGRLGIDRAPRAAGETAAATARLCRRRHERRRVIRLTRALPPDDRRAARALPALGLGLGLGLGVEVLLAAKPHPPYPVIVTDVGRDDYRSTLGKGFLGLEVCGV